MSITQQHLFDAYRARSHAAPEPPAPGSGYLALLRAASAGWRGRRSRRP
ncbi:MULTISPECIES: hypothetical protein [unclassified Streptomyces]|nr:hypothetical protein [Streptomyces sp. SID4985]MYQ47379.1 hypothetical protein [Streptomyces sp. SID4985]